MFQSIHIFKRSLFVLLILSIFLVALVSVFSFEPHQLDGTPRAGWRVGDRDGAYSVYVVDHGWHTGIIMPAKRLNSLLPALKMRFGDADFYEIGWGDKGFYQTKDVTAMLSLQAFFNSSGAVMHVAAVRDPEKYFLKSQVTKLCMADAQLAGLEQFVMSSFARDANGLLIPQMKGLYGNSQFFEGVGQYHLFNTCNHWSAKGLSSAGMDITPAFKLTSGSVMRAIEMSACGG